MWFSILDITILKEPIEKYNGRKFDNQAKVDDLANKLNKIVDDLGSMILLSRERQENLVYFCLNLCSSASTYRTKNYGFRRI